MKKKFLLYANYYYPEVASIAQLYTELAENLTKEFDVTVICAIPCYTGNIDKKYLERKYHDDEVNGVKIIRVRVSEFDKSNKKSRVKHILSYFFNSMSATFKVGKQDIVFSCSQPPILGGLLGVWGKWIKHAKYIYNIQDFNPEQTIATGYSKNKLVLNTMMFFDKFSCKHSDLVITVGRDLIETLKNRFPNGRCPKYALINNWMDEKLVYPINEDNENIVSFKQKYGIQNKFIIMYSGNLGLYYDLENILKVIEKFPSGTTSNDGREVAFVFVGEGTIKNKLVEYQKSHNMNNVYFIPYQDKKDLIYSLNSADVHWCVNSKGIKGVSCPSKMYGIMSAGKPVLGVLEKGAEVRLIMEETNCGLVCEPNQYKDIENNIKTFLNMSNQEIKSMGLNGRYYLEKNLTKDVSINKYIDAIKNC